jgi:putative aldouronate transport system permease protein
MPQDVRRLTMTKAYRSHLLRDMKKQFGLHAFVWAGIAFLLIFSYTPMVGIIIAFKDYKISDGIAGMLTSEFNSFKWFKEFFTDYRFLNILRNTLAISFLKLVFSFPMPIVFAIMINEVRSGKFKRFTQTVSYLPHFISWVIISGICVVMFSQSDGAINNILVRLSIIEKGLPILTSSKYYYGFATITSIWKETGWWSIIFLAAIAGIDQEIYESAMLDGAGRLQRIRHITLPGMKDSIIVVLILAIGSFLGGGLVGSNFEQSFLLGNRMNNDASELIQTYAFKVGLQEGRFAYGAAVDLLQSIVAVILLYSTNGLSKKLSGTGLY